MDILQLRSIIVLVSMVLFMSQPALGQQLIRQSFTDQFDRMGELNNTTKYLLFGASMQSGKVAKEAFEALDIDQDFLDQNQILYVSDVRAMPNIITELFALPKMRKYSFSVYLLEEDTNTGKWPGKEDALTVMHLNNLKVQHVDHFSDSASFIEFLKTGFMER